jgi:hypothetical protein
MKIDKVIFSCDGSYFLFWEHVSEIVKKVLGMEPVLFFITEKEESDFYRDEFGIVKKVKMLDFVSPSLLSQNYRFYGTKYFQDEVCLISDIDMILFNKSWLETHLNNIPDNDLVILNSDAYTYGESNSPLRYPACYTVAKGNVFNKIINTDRSIEDFMQEIVSLNAGWDSDEIYFTDKVINGNHGVHHHPIKRGYSSFYYAPGRMEKYMFTDEESTRVGKLSLQGKINYDTFIDCHCWKYNMDLVNKIKKELLEYYKPKN